jgi:hypothetical protein
VTVALLDIALVLGAASWLLMLALTIRAVRAHRRARATATACNFPGCAQARAELRALAAEHEHVPSRAVLDVVEGVETKENR